jgi:polyhydroxyalkanoate synthesis regulator phasin
LTHFAIDLTRCMANPMNSDTAFELVQKSFRITLGATATLIEVLQDPQRRDENLSKLNTELSQLAEEWAAKGEMTEQEARNFVDTILQQQSPSSSPSEPTTSTASAPTGSTTTSTPSPVVQMELQELTAQIAAIRAELEKLREQEQ